ncbi:MAG: hypothetical protein BRC25_03050 [Parcubacteria group bacterium SW_6_46_9]|nr:MAG: hypothetical protein BRC25_03050 [Parcubacteria group bacterium SW_6_46_9]
MYRPKLYLAGKLRDFTDGKPVEERIAQEEANRRLAHQTAEQLWNMGFRVIVPHSMMGLPTPTAIQQNSSLDVDEEAVMQTRLEPLTGCDALFLRNGQDSLRAIEKCHYTEQFPNLPVLYNYEKARQYLERAQENCRPFLPEEFHSNGRVRAGRT